jgi:hypothetical protein
MRDSSLCGEMIRFVKVHFIILNNAGVFVPKITVFRDLSGDLFEKIDSIRFVKKFYSGCLRVRSGCFV